MRGEWENASRELAAEKEGKWRAPIDLLLRTDRHLYLRVARKLVNHLVSTGVGVWGLNNPVGWGWAIVNFVFWVGIGHAGTLISAILFLLRQKWRTSINRFAEAMTIFAVVCAGIFPGIHVGRDGGSQRVTGSVSIAATTSGRSA